MNQEMGWFLVMWRPRTLQLLVRDWTKVQDAINPDNIMYVNLPTFFDDVIGRSLDIAFYLGVGCFKDSRRTFVGSMAL